MPEINPRVHSVLLVTIALTAALLSSAIIHADAHSEREMLNRLAQQIQALDELIDRAEAESEPDARVQFQYQWLRQDLVRVRKGIEDYVRGAHHDRRTYPPIEGEYQR